jgi:hypothetical protein
MASKSKTEDNSTKPLDMSGQLVSSADYKDAPYTDDVTEAEIRNQANIAGVDTANPIAFNDFRNEYIRQHANPEYEEEAGTEDRPDYLEREGGTVNAQPYGGETPENPDDAPEDDTMRLILDEVTQLSQDFAEVTKTIERFSKQHDQLTARDDAIIDEFRLKFEDIRARLERISGGAPSEQTYPAGQFVPADVHGARVDMSSIDKLPRVT